MLFCGISRDSKVKYSSDMYLLIVSRHIYVGPQYAIMHPEVDLKILSVFFLVCYFNCLKHP